MKTNNNTSIVLSDVHLPFAQPVATQMVVEFIREQKPGRVHLLGDILDAASVSRFDKDPARKENLQDELDSVRDWLAKLRDAAPRAKIIYTEGNHEFRLRKYLMSDAKALAGLRALTLGKLLDLDKLKIRWQPYGWPYRIGHLLFTHGQFVSRWSAMSAKRHYERFGCCVIHGHTHRLGAFYHTDIFDTFAAFENGCLSTLTPDYVTAPDWQNGFSVVYHSKDFFHVDQVAIVRNRFCFHGKLYEKRNNPTTGIVEDLT